MAWHQIKLLMEHRSSMSESTHFTNTHKKKRKSYRRSHLRAPPLFMLACRRKHARWRGTQHRVAWEAPQSPLDSALRCGAQGGAPRSSSMDGGLRGAYSVPRPQRTRRREEGRRRRRREGRRSKSFCHWPCGFEETRDERERASVVGRPVQGP